MVPFLPVAEKRSFFIFFIVCLITIFIFAWSSPQLFLLGILFFSLFSFFRLTALLDRGARTLPAIISLPAQLLSGLSDAEDQFKEMIWSTLIHKIVLSGFVLGAIFMIWMAFNSFIINSSPSLDVFFNQTIPTIDRMSYFNIYTFIFGLISLTFYGLVFCTAVSYGMSINFIKKLFLLLLAVFFFLFLFTVYNSQITVSVPPFYTFLLSGLGVGMAEQIMNQRSDLFITPPSGLYARYLDLGLIGVVLFYSIFLPLTFLFIHKLKSVSLSKIWAAGGLFCLLFFLLSDVFLTIGNHNSVFNFTGLLVLGFASGACLIDKKLDKP